MRLTSRFRVLAMTLAVVGQLVGGFIVPVGAAADSAIDPLDLARAGVPIEVASTAWRAEATARVALASSASRAAPHATDTRARALAPAAALVPSDGKKHLVRVNGHRLAIWCRGVGSPTVLLEHGIGYGVDSDSWEDVQEGIAAETRVCRYDRAFVGDSDDAKVGRSMPDLAEDLSDLLAAALIPGPYILVGHSFGGLVVRNYAKLNPGSVVGMVLVDGSPRSAIVNLDLGSERLNRTRVLAQLIALEKAGALGHLPLVVITRGIGASAAWRAEQLKMVKLSTSSRQVIATQSDHWIQLRQPDLVIRQVLTVVHTIRRHS